MRPEPHYDEHRRSQAARAQAADRRVAPATLDALLRWLTIGYAAETPNLQHSVGLMGDDGTPKMTGSILNWLGLEGGRVAELPLDKQRPDDWLYRASYTDDNGDYRTPMRRAIELLPNDGGPFSRRDLARSLAPGLMFPEDVARVLGVPGWLAKDAIYRTLELLWEKYEEAPLPKASGRSEAQLDADAA